MNKLIKNIEFESKYLKYKRILLFMIIFFMAINALTIYMENQFVSFSYDDYKRMQQFYKENPDEVEDDTNYEVIEGDDNTLTINNPLPYYFDLTSKALFVVSPQYCVAQVLEMSFVLLPLLFALFGVFFANCDTKNGVYKHKILRYGRENYYLTKLIIGISVIVVGIIITAFIGKVANIPFYRYICKTYPIEEFDLGRAEMLSNDFVKIAIIILVCLVIYSLAFLLALFTKNSTISLLLVILYNYLSPINTTYGIRNCCRALVLDKFDMYGVVSVSDIKTVNITLAIIILIGVILISQFLSFLIIKKRSAYI